MYKNSVKLKHSNRAKARTIKYVVITGCSSGFGRLLIDQFANRGWSVLATTRHPELLAGLSGNIQVLAADVATEKGRLMVVEHVHNRWSGVIDCLVNNAGYCQSGPLELLSDAQIRKQMEVNFVSVVLLTQRLLPNLRTSRAKVINLSSMLGFVGMPLMSLYAASKYALEGWSESLFYELEPQGVQVCLVEPAGYRTGFANHMEWPLQEEQFHSVYATQLGAFKALQTRLSQKGKGNSPIAVINKIFGLANRSKMPQRVRVGSAAHFLYYLRCFLPQPIADSLIGKMYRQLMQAK